ncbi:MAG TPA: zf-HC2 domain-containing protein [Gaiellaceae bacterium]|nr:zf-HC2 domain-containing protein [Gaiellaceae bacterium]
MTQPLEQLSCQELVELVTDYLEGALPDEDRRRFEEHLATCDGCSTYVEQMRTTLRVTGELKADALTPEAEAALREAFREWGAS